MTNTTNPVYVLPKTDQAAPKKVRQTVMTLDKRVTTLERQRMADAVIQEQHWIDSLQARNRMRGTINNQGAAIVAVIFISAVAFIVSVVTAVSTL